MEFSNIRLSWREYRTLKKAEKRGVPKCECNRFLHLKFVEEELEHVPGYMGKPTGTCRITDLGRDYLAYWDSELKIRYITPVIVTILTNAVIHGSPALWRWILQLEAISPKI